MRKTDNSHNRIFTRLVAMLMALIISLPASLASCPITAQAAGGVIKLSAAKSVSVARSSRIEAIELQISSKRAARDSAVRSLREKEHNMSTFRWSPLLNFKFPTKPSEAESFEFQYKPTQLEYQIKDLQHKITDEKLSEYEKVSNIYIQIIQAQQELDFINRRIDTVTTAYQKAIARNQIGEVSDEVVQKLADRKKSLESNKTTQESKFQRSKEKLGKEMGGLDLTTGYKFENAFATANMSRSNIEFLQEYALERDHTVYEAQQNADLALLSLQTNYSLYRGHYGRFIGTIDTYIQQAIDGSDVNQKAFTKDYDKFLEQIDSPWNGNYKILFIKFPKEWLKGDNDGMNWIEDDPKVLFTDTLNYVSARKELENTKDELRSSIEEGYDTYAELRRAYLDSTVTREELQNKLVADEIRNLMGELENDEFEAEQQEYEEALTGENDALAQYSQNLYSYDKTTCGGASKFMETADTSDTLDKQLDALQGITKVGAHYSIRSIISDSEFVVTIDVPEYNDQEYLDEAETEKNPDYFPWNITDFELRINQRTVGTKTSKNGSVRHLKLDKDNADEVVIRLWDGNEFIDDVVIDPTVPWGPLDITVRYETPEGAAGAIGTYEVTDDTTTDMIRLDFKFDQEVIKKEFGQGKDAAFYNLSADRTLYLFSDHLIAIDQPFNYLSFIRGDLGQLSMRLFDDEGNFLGGARFDSVNQKLIADADISRADMQDAALRELAVQNKVSELNDELIRARQSLQSAQESGDRENEEYYKKRIEELKDQIDHAGESITDEDLEKVRTEQAEALEQLTESMTEELGKSEEQKAKDAENELKKQQILRDAADEMIGRMKYEEAMADLKEQKEAWAYKETELQLEFNRLSATVGASSDEAKEVLAQLQAAKRKKRALQDEIESHSAFNRDEFPVSEEEIQALLNNYPEEVYGYAGDLLDQLGDFTGPAYESAKAEAELYGLETSAANIKFMMGYTEELKQCKAIEAQIEQMQKDKDNLEKQMEAIKAMPDDDPRKTGQMATLVQLEKVNAAYEKQLGILEKRADQLNPAKALRRKQISAVINQENKSLKEMEAVRDSAKQKYDGAVQAVADNEQKLYTASQNLVKYAAELKAARSSAKSYEQLENNANNRINRLRSELADMNWFEKIGNAARRLWGDSHEDRIAATQRAASDAKAKKDEANAKADDLQNNLIPAAEKDKEDAINARAGLEKARDDAEVPYKAAQDDVDDQQGRVDKLVDLLKSV
ncbi:MAG: hypothetical protein IJ058_04310 [Lachnospiraceae bacterium]|nr:hypothetical protein [Lachnospiraceae bacterium]